MAEKVIKLSRVYTPHDTKVDVIALRAPKWADFIAIGDPVEQQPLPGGDGAMIVKHLDRIDAYAKRLVQPPVDGGFIDGLDLTDALAVEEAIHGFFVAARSSR